MKKNTLIQVLIFTFLFSVVSIDPLQAQSNFTIEDFWEDGGAITFEIDYEEDFPGSISDLDLTTDGTFVYNGTSEGTSIFNFSLTSRAQELTLAQGSTILDPLGITGALYPFNAGDKLDYSFTVSNGTIEFFVFNQSQFNSWLNGTDSQSLQAIEVIYTEIGTSGTVTFVTTDYYYIIWFNDPIQNDNNPVILQLRLDAIIVEKSTKGGFELDPRTLESVEGEIIDDFGIDTSDWKINDQVSIEVDEREVYFSIEREEDLSISYNENTVDIPCWVLEVEDYERTFVEKVTYSTIAEMSIWKSKYSGITLKSVIDMEYFDTNDSLFRSTYEKFTVESADNVLLISKSSGVTFPIIPTIIALFVIIQFKKKRN